MSSGEVRKVSRQDIQLVQNLIERCLQLYMSQKEVVDTLLHQAKIEPGFTELVWQKLEEENQEFFRAYHLRLIVKDQISRFNELLERQVELMHQTCPTGIASIPMSNGSQIPSMHQSTVCHAPEHTVAPMKSEIIHPDICTNLHNAYNDGASSLPPEIHTNLHNIYNNGASSDIRTNLHNTYNNDASSLPPHNHTNLHNAYNNGASSLPPIPAAIDMSTHSRRIDPSSNMTFTQNPNVGMIQGMNGGMIRPEAGYAGNTHMFGADSNVMNARYTSAQPNSQPLNETILHPENSSFGFLGQIPRNFSLSDLTADFSNSSDILESYCRSPFLGADPDSFLDPHGKGGEHRENKRLDSISEGLSYEGFGSD